MRVPGRDLSSIQKRLSLLEHVCPFLKWNLCLSYTAILTSDIRSA